MFRTAISLIALIVSSSIVSADPGGKRPYDEAKACLEQITVSYGERQYSMREGVHFGPYAGSGNPDEIIAAGITLKAGVREHPSWKPKIAEIEKCLGKIPNLGFVGRTN